MQHLALADLTLQPPIAKGISLALHATPEMMTHAWFVIGMHTTPLEGGADFRAMT